MPIRILKINASDNVFGPGSIYALNLSHNVIAGTLGDKKLQMKPESTTILENPVSANGFYAAKVYFARKEDKKPRPFIKQMWEHSNTTRQVLFIFSKPPPHYATYFCAEVRDF